MRFSFRSHFGLAWLGFIALASYVALLFRPVGGHYLLFSSAARAYWNAQPMYETSFDIGLSGYFYSPTCAGFFYSIFAFLPNAWGRALYVGASLALLAASIGYLRLAYLRQFKSTFDSGIAGQLLWVMLSSEINGAILAEKIEITILAIFFFSLGLCWEKRYAPAIALLVLVANWKFQSLPILGLVLMLLLRERRFWKYPLGALAGWAFLFFLPFVFHDSAYLWNEISKWHSSLAEFMPNAWMSPIFHHVYGFTNKALGGEISYATAQKISIGFGILFAAVLALQFYRRKEGAELGFATAFGLGTAFSVLCSPLSQGTGYLIYLPLPILVVLQARKYEVSERLLFCVLLLAYYFVSLSVSDLTPQPLRAWFYGHAFKALGSVILILIFIAQEIRRSAFSR